MMPAGTGGGDDDVDDVDERPRHVVELLMPFAEKLAEMVPGALVSKIANGSNRNAKALASSGEGTSIDEELANRPNWEARELVDLEYASRKAEAKRAAKESQATRSFSLSALQARIMADPALVQHLVAIKSQLASDEIESLMTAIGMTSEAEQTKLLDSIKSLPVAGAVAFCRELVAAVREHARTSAESSS